MRRSSSITYRPEVVDQNVEDTEQHHKHDRTPLGLETDNHHDTSDEAGHTDDDAPHGPLSREDESDKEEDQEHATSELDIHLAVLLIQLGQTGGHELLAHPRVGENHEKTANHAEVAQEEVEVEDESVSKALSDDDAQQTGDREFGVSASNHEERAYRHRNDVDDQEGVGDTPRD